MKTFKDFLAEGGSYNNWLLRDTNQHLTTVAKGRGDYNSSISKKLHADNNFSDDHIKAIQNYSKSSKSLNQALINNETLSDEQAHLVHHLDDAIDKNRIKHRMTLYSGLGFDPREKADSEKIIKTPSYLSTSHEKLTADRGTKNTYDKHMLQIHAKPGDPITHISGVSNYGYEHEAILGRNTKLKLKKTEEYYDNHTDSNVYVHHVTLA